MSTMQGSLFPSHRRQGSAPTSDAPSPIRYSPSSSALSNRISNPIASSKSSPSLRSIPSRQPDSTVNRRIDATSQLLGRSNADARSFFDGSSIRSKASLPSVDPPNEDPTNRGAANRSPIKHTSPEIARRASQFELPPSPTKATFPLLASAHPGQVPANNFGFAQDDPLKEIEQRRNARRARIESIRNLYAPRIEPASPRTDSIRDEWTEVERKEREQAQSDAEIEIKNIYRPTGLVAPFSPISQASRPLSPQLPTFCEVSQFCAICSFILVELTSPSFRAIFPFLLVTTMDLIHLNTILRSGSLATASLTPKTSLSDQPIRTRSKVLSLLSIFPSVIELMGKDLRNR